jgi:peptidyl-prolyl cis-trans isomerase B (cyclophilin B)
MTRILAALTIAAACVALVSGCEQTTQKEPTIMEDKQPTPPPGDVGGPTGDEADAKAGTAFVELETEKGQIVLEIDASAAPAAASNFLGLVRDGFYDGMPFHRVEPGFVIQAGDPAQVGRPPVDYTISDETSPITHVRGAVAMARLFGGGQMIPNSASTQFYICLGDAPHLDDMGFTAFGRVIEGDEVLDDIRVGDKIIRAVAEPSATGSR